LVPTIPPTITPYPTYTPIPSPTKVPTATLPPTDTPLAISPSAESPTNPINCVPSATIGYNSCTDDTGNLLVDVPDTWSDFNGSTWTYKGQDIGFAISAAPHLSDFQTSFNAEGMFFGASETFAQIIGHIELLDYYTIPYRENCTYIGRSEYIDGVYRGRYDKYSDCGGAGGFDAYVLGARDITEPSTKLILIEIQIYPNDAATVNQILNTFYVYF
jgi:hypothetical protein